MHLITINHLVKYVVVGRTSEELINLAMNEFRKVYPGASIQSIEVTRISNTDSKVLKFTPQ